MPTNTSVLSPFLMRQSSREGLGHRRVPVLCVLLADDFHLAGVDQWLHELIVALLVHPRAVFTLFPFTRATRTGDFFIAEMSSAARLP